MFWLLQIIKLGTKSLMLHKLRSALTVLGIIFGVCSVIAMLSIGEGASQEAQEKVRLLGTNNIIIRSVKPPEGRDASAAHNVLSIYGLTHRDADLMATTLPAVEMVAPMRDLRTDVQCGERRFDARVIATLPHYPRLVNWQVTKGRFLCPVDESTAANVCVLGSRVARELFGYREPMGKDVRIGGDYYRVVGVMSPRGGNEESNKVETDLDRDVYIPLRAARSRFGEIIVRVRSGTFEREQVELHQVNVRVRNTEDVLGTAQAIKTILAKTHTQADYEMTVPLELLQQAEATKRIFSIVLGSIAGISLLVGGIGIMNIMLATITERTREIGIRRALGAKKRDIRLQFLVETVVLAGFGGVLGIALGVTIPHLVTHFSQMRTVVTMDSLVLAFGISAATGIIFGLYPAWRAANMDPIEALRHE
jgi:putative ABC transport system permease protein